MQYPMSKDHLENVEKIMNCNQMKQLLMEGLQCKCCVVSCYTCSDLFRHWNLRVGEFVKPFVYFYSLILSKSYSLLNTQLLAGPSLSSDVTQNFTCKFHTRLSLWKIITLPTLFWESEREGSGSCSSILVDCLTLQTYRWTNFCHANNALYYIYDSVL